MSERFGIEPCQWQNLSDEHTIQWHCRTHGVGMWEDPQGELCECAQGQLRAGLAGREEILPILTDLIAHLRADLRIAEYPIAAECITIAEARLDEGESA